MTYQAKKNGYEYAHLPLLTAQDVPNTPLMECLYKALSLKRAGGSITEAHFVSWLVHRLPVTLIDEAGNIHVDTRQGPQDRTMFTAHTDTVHWRGGANSIRTDGKNWYADEGECLGADDGAGVALMYHMIVHNVPGYYVFFRGEESGGTGSRWLATSMPDALHGIDHCVSFDRAGHHDVVTHQGGQECCSAAFATALAAALTNEDMTLAFMPDSTGVFTDSKNLRGIVPECTNVSVGYFSQHGDAEWLNVSFLQELAAALVKVKWGELPVERDPKARGNPYGVWVDNVSTMDAEQPHYDQFREDMLYGLQEVVEDGSTTALATLIAEEIMPDDTAMALRFISVSRVSPEWLQDALQGLRDDDYDAEDIMSTLIETCATN